MPTVVKYGLVGAVAFTLSIMVQILAIQKPKVPEPIVQQQQKYDDTHVLAELSAMKAELRTELASIRLREIAPLQVELGNNKETIKSIIAEVQEVRELIPETSDETLTIHFEKIESWLKNLNNRTEKLEFFAKDGGARINALETAFVASDHAVIMNIQKAQQQKAALQKRNRQQ